MNPKFRNEAGNENYPHLLQQESLPGWLLPGLKTGKCLPLGEGRHLTSLPRLQLARLQLSSLELSSLQLARLQLGSLQLVVA